MIPASKSFAESYWGYSISKVLLLRQAARKFTSEVWLLGNSTLEGFESFFESLQHSAAMLGPLRKLPRSLLFATCFLQAPRGLLSSQTLLQGR